MDSNDSDLQYEAKTETSFPDLEQLIEQGKNDEVVTVLNENPSLLSITDASSQTLLHVATKHNNSMVMEYLIKGGCDIEAKTNTGWTPLMIAADCYRRRSQDPKPAEILLKYNADIFATNSKGESVIQFYLLSLRKKFLPFIDLFFEKAKIRSTNNTDLLDILQKAECQLQDITHFRNVELTKMFLDKREDIEQIDWDGIIAVSCCMDYTYEENLRVILHYCDAGIKFRRLYLILYFRTIISRPNIEEHLSKKIEMFVRILIDFKFLNHNEAWGIDQIFFRVNEKQLCELLKTDLNYFVKKKLGYEPVVYVFGNPNPGIFNLIEKEKFDVNLRGRNGVTALHIAFRNKIQGHIKYLLENNLDPNVTDNSGKPLIFSTFFGGLHSDRNACLKLVLKYNVDIQVCDSDGKTFVEYGPPRGPPTPENEETFKTIAAHLAMLESCGIPIKAAFIDFINSTENLIKYYKTIRKQLEQMQVHKIYGTLTLFTVLKHSYNFVSYRVRTMHPDLVKSLCSPVNNDLAEYDCYYTDIIRDRIQVAYELHKMRNQAAAVIFDCIDQLKGYMVVADVICSFISYEHLHKIVYPSHEKDCGECKLSNLACYQFVKEIH